MSLFWKLEREIGLQEALECFHKVVDSGKEELDHDVMGCQDRWVHGDIVSTTPITLITAVLLGRIVTAWLLSIVPTFLPLIQTCISIVWSQ